jgi:hypothetical protein
MQITENASFDNPKQVGFAAMAAALTAQIMIPTSRQI